MKQNHCIDCGDLNSNPSKTMRRVCFDCFFRRSLIFEDGITKEEFEEFQRSVRRRNGSAKATICRIMDAWKVRVLDPEVAEYESRAMTTTEPSCSR